MEPTSNWTKISTFLLAGFSSCPLCQKTTFSLFLLVYIFTLLENLSIIALIVRDNKLWKPMYIFLGNLSFLEVWYISVTLPNVITNIITGNREISYCGCVTQLFVFTFLGATECFLLATMAYDRYVAICYPLRYTVIMQDKFVLFLLIVSWLTGLFTPIVPIWFLTQLNFCGTNEVNHYFCDVSPLLKLACGNIKPKEIVDLTVSVFVLICSMLVIFISYICITRAILKMPSSTGRYKAFSTCASHLTIVCVYYGSMSFTYIRVESSSPVSTNKLVSVLYSVITPMLNPIIYTLRNKDVRQAIQKVCQKPKLSKLGL
ncbi:olfactory receptor 6B9-like [Dendropsophus ebraccatus]|uniref:olfactory receptor 6B9-like n=1 Tax=Dendropsophus ebraccatus TaxID=150705 RepID=UPI0038310DAE